MPRFALLVFTLTLACSTMEDVEYDDVAAPDSPAAREAACRETNVLPANLNDCLDAASSRYLTASKIRACGETTTVRITYLDCLDYGKLRQITTQEILSCGKTWSRQRWLECMDSALEQ
jgi:hypothetical protein